MILSINFLLSLLQENFLAVLAAYTIYYLIGAIWFMFIFKRQYAISLGKEGRMPQKIDKIYIIGPAICTFVITITTALFIFGMNEVEDYTSALTVGGIIAVGYLVANTMNCAINPNMPRPILYGMITSAYHVVGILMVSIILMAFKAKASIL